jgi:hypothetical protein
VAAFRAGCGTVPVATGLPRPAAQLRQVLEQNLLTGANPIVWQPDVASLATGEPHEAGLHNARPHVVNPHEAGPRLRRTEPLSHPAPATPGDAEPQGVAVACRFAAADGSEGMRVAAQEAAVDPSVPVANSPEGAGKAASGSVVPAVDGSAGASTAALEVPVTDREVMPLPTALHGSRGNRDAAQEAALDSSVPAGASKAASKGRASKGRAGKGRASKAASKRRASKAQAVPLADGDVVPPPPVNWMDTQEDRDEQRRLAALGLPWLPEFEEQLVAHAKALCSRVCDQDIRDAG